MTRERPITVVLLDDMHLMRQALKALLSLDGSPARCVGDSDDVHVCTALAQQHAAQVIILNAEMRDGAGLAALRALTPRAVPSRLLAVGGDDDPERVVAIYRAGAAGYLPRNATTVDLHDAIEATAAGLTYVGPGTAKAIATGLRDTAVDGTRSGARARIGKLSDRETTVLRYVARGYSGPEIAERLGITSKTVDTYRHRIQEKIGLRHRSEYVRLSLDAGMLAD